MPPSTAPTVLAPAGYKEGERSSSTALPFHVAQEMLPSGKAGWTGKEHPPTPSGAFLVAQRLKSLPGMRETRVRPLGREDPLEKVMATYSSTLAWKIPRREEPVRLQSMGSQRVRHD